MKLKILPPSELKKKVAAKMEQWKQAKRIAERQGRIPDYANASLVLMNRVKKVGLLEEERKKLDSGLLKIANEGDSSKRDEEIRRLLEFGANVNVQDGNGWTLLMVEAMTGAVYETIEILIAYGAELDLQNSEGNTALHIAAEFNNARAAEILAKAGADPHIKNKAGKDAMDFVKMWGRTDVAEILEGNGAKSGEGLP